MSQSGTHLCNLCYSNTAICDAERNDGQEQVMNIAEERAELTVSASAKTGEGLDSFVTCLEVTTGRPGIQLLVRVATAKVDPH